VFTDKYYNDIFSQKYIFVFINFMIVMFYNQKFIILERISF
jgi:hypothetical protein